MEEELTLRCKTPPGEVLVDLPSVAMLDLPPRLAKIHVKVKRERVHTLKEVSPLARALQMRPVTDWAVQVICAPEHVEKVAKKAPGLLFH